MHERHIRIGARENLTFARDHHDLTRAAGKIAPRKHLQEACTTGLRTRRAARFGATRLVRSHGARDRNADENKGNSRYETMNGHLWAQLRWLVTLPVIIASAHER